MGLSVLVIAYLSKKTLVQVLIVSNLVFLIAVTVLADPLSEWDFLSLLPFLRIIPVLGILEGLHRAARENCENSKAAHHFRTMIGFIAVCSASLLFVLTVKRFAWKLPEIFAPVISAIVLTLSLLSALYYFVAFGTWIRALRIPRPAEASRF